MSQSESPAERNDINSLLRMLKVVRGLDPEMPSQTLQAILEVALQPRIEQFELQARLGLSTAATSRIVARLSKWKKYKVEGLELLEAQHNPLDRRTSIVELTPKGEAFVSRLMLALQRADRETASAG